MCSYIQYPETPSDTAKLLNVSIFKAIWLAYLSGLD